MTEVRVLNKKTDVIPEDAVYIGRGSKWGNPYRIDFQNTRGDVILKFWDYLLDNPSLMEDAVLELRGKDLVCFCAPEACHGDVWKWIANGNGEWKAYLK